MRCNECPHFKILYDPYGYEWGKVKCEKYNLYADYKSKQNLNRFTCEQAQAVKEDKEMTHEEAIKLLRSEQRRNGLEYNTGGNNERYEAYEMAIAALEEQITRGKDIRMYRNILTNAWYGEQLD